MHFSFLQGVAAEEHDTTALVGATLMDGYMEQALAAYFGFSTDRCSLLKRVGVRLMDGRRIISGYTDFSSAWYQMKAFTPSLALFRILTTQGPTPWAG
jgi:hypothetical protein